MGSGVVLAQQVLAVVVPIRRAHHRVDVGSCRPVVLEVDAALMIESGGHRRFDKLIVVWCEPDLQLQRLMRRDNLSATDAGKRVAAQMSQDEKKKHADFLIDTSNDYESTRRQVAEVFERLKLS